MLPDVWNARRLALRHGFWGLCFLFLTVVATPIPAVTTIFPADLDSRWISAIANDRADDFPPLLTEVAQAGPAIQEALLALGTASGKTALMVAAKRGRLDLVRQLVAAGADIRQRTHTGGSALMFAALGNHLSVADWLYRNGADIDARGSNDWSALTIAVAKGYPETLEWLLAQGADPGHADIYGVTPLMRAIDNGHAEIALRLLRVDALAVDVYDESDNTALHYAVARGFGEIVERLLVLGANPDARNRNGQTPRTMVSGESPLQVILARFPPGSSH